jgi:hypothetical protein
MRYEDVITEQDGYRVVIEADEYPEPPYFEGGAPVLRIEPSSYGARSVEHIDAGTDNRTSDARIEEAVRHWSTHPGEGGWFLFEKYLRAFYGVKHIETFYSGDYWYVAYDPTDEITRLGLEAAEATHEKWVRTSLAEYDAWVNGDVHVVVTQKLVHWTSDRGTERDAWEVVDSIGGFYGYDAAKEYAENYALQNAG